MKISAICRKASKADLPGVLRLYAQPDIDDGNVHSVSEAEYFFERISQYPDYHMYVVVCDQQIVGTTKLGRRTLRVKGREKTCRF
jgi:hypothetical protein